MNESTSWRRGFTAGFAVLALSVGGQIATRESDVRTGASTRSCPLSRSHVSAPWTERVEPRAEAAGLAQRVARAVVGAVLHSCS
jgi:hypothetical protein